MSSKLEQTLAALRRDAAENREFSYFIPRDSLVDIQLTRVNYVMETIKNII